MLQGNDLIAESPLKDELQDLLYAVEAPKNAAAVPREQRNGRNVGRARQGLL